jgi:DNA-binding NarL/FixJ family response regulator
MTSDIRVLIVDDDVPTRIGLRTILSSEPGVCLIGEAATGEEAIELANRLHPDVVLMDIQLPDVDGIAVTSKLTAPAEGQRAPRVIVLTTFDYDEYSFGSLRAGASGFLLKRTSAEELVEAVRTVAAGGSIEPAHRHRTLTGNATGAGGWHTDAVQPLTARESEILVLIARGLSNQEIATSLGLSIETVRTHVKHVYMKCGAHDRVHAVIVAYQSRLLPLVGPRQDRVDDRWGQDDERRAHLARAATPRSSPEGS